MGRAPERDLAGEQGESAAAGGTAIISGTTDYLTVTSGTVELENGAVVGDGEEDAITFSGGASTLALGAISLAGPLDIQAGTLTFDQSVDPTLPANVTIATPIVGAGAIIKANSGTLTLTGIDTYSGGTTINAGVLSIASDNGLGATSGTLTLAGGMLETTAALTSQRGVTLESSGTVQVDAGTTTLSGIVGGTSALVKTGVGTLALSGANTYAGGTTVTAGTLSIGADTNLGVASGALTLVDSTLETTSNLSSQRAVQLQGVDTVQVDTGTTALSGVVSGNNGSLTKTGAGSLILATSDTYRGGTTVSAGTLSIASDNALGAQASALTLAGGTLETTATLASQRLVNLQTSGTLQVDTGATTLSGQVVGNSASALAKTGSGTLVLGGNNLYGGGTTIEAGTVSVASDNGLGQQSGTVTLATGTLETTNGGFMSRRTITLQTFGTIQVDTGTATFAGVIGGSGDLLKNGAGTLALTGVNTFTGPLFVNAGTLSAATDSALGASSNAVLLTSATLETSGSFASGRTIAIFGDGTIRVDSGTTTLSGTISDQGPGLYGDIVKTGAGTLVLSGANTYSFGTAIDAGTVSISSDGDLGLAPSPVFGAVVLAGGTLETTASLTSQRAFIFNATGTLQVDSGTTTLAGAISGSGALTKLGAGSLDLAGTDSASGGINLKAGTLELANASAAGAGAITFGSSAATLKVDGAVGLGNAITGFSQNDMLDLTGLAYAPGEHATLVGTTLTVSNGTASEVFKNFSLASGLTLGQAGLVLADAADGGAGSDVVVLTDTGISTPTIAFAATNSAIGAADIDSANAKTATYTVGSVDPYAVATVTFTGVSNTTGQMASVAGVGTNGTHTIDLGGFQDGIVTASISDYDPAGNTASASTTAVLATTTAYTGVTTAQAFGADIAAIDLTSRASGGTGTAFSVTLAPGATLSGSAAASLVALTGGDTLTIKGDNATIAGGAIVLRGSQAVTLASDPGSTLTDADIVSDTSGAGSVTIVGGTVALTTADNYGGGTYVDSGTAAVSNTNAFGTGTVHLVDPSIEYETSGVYSNAISLDQSGSAAATPAILTIDSGVTATITGAISAGTGTNAQGNTISTNQSLLVAGPGTLAVANGSATTPAPTISGSTLQVDSAGFTALVSYVAPLVVEKTQTTVIGTVTPDIKGIALTLNQATGSIGIVTLGPVQSDGTQQVIYTAPTSVATSTLDAVSYTIINSTNGVVATGSNSVQLDAGATVVSATPAVVEKGQTTIVGTVTAGITGDTLTLTQASGSLGTLTLGTAVNGVQQVIYTAPASVAASTLDKVSYTVVDQHNDVVVSGSNSVQLDAGATIVAAIPATVEKNQTTVVGTVTAGLAGDMLTLTQASGSLGSLTLGAVVNGVRQVIYTAPASVAASTLDKVSYAVVDQHNDVVASGSTGVQLDAGASIVAGTPTAIEKSQTTVIGTVTAGLAGDTLKLTQASGSLGTLTLGTAVNGVQQVIYTAPISVGSSAVDKVSYTVTDQHNDVVASGGNSVQLDAGATIVSATPGVVEKGQTTVIGMVTAGIVGDTLKLTQGSGSLGTLALGTAVNGVQQVIYTAPTSVASSAIDKVSYTVIDQHADVVASGSNSVQLDAGPSSTSISATVALGQSTNLTSAILKSATPGLSSDTLKITMDNLTATAGSVSFVNGVLTYTASGAGLSHIAANGSQVDSFTYTVSDPYGGTTTSTAKITVTNPAMVINGPLFGFSTIQGTAGTDIINASGFFNTIYDNGGNDVVNAGLGNATVNAGAGDVVTNLAGFFDSVAGGDGYETVSGSAGNATITLGNGNDTVSTGGFGNAITLGNGPDTVNAGLGQSQVILGNGNDMVTIAGFSNSVIAGNGNDGVSGGSGLDVVTLGNGNDAVTTSGYGNQIAVGSGANTIAVANGGLGTITAGAGTDAITLSGTGNSVTLNGSTATVSGGQGLDTVSVNGGKDMLTFAGSSDVATLKGTTTASIMDLGNALRINVGSSTQTDTLAGVGSKDTTGTIDFQNGAGGYTSVSQVIAALHSDGAGGTMLALGTTGSIDFAGTAASQLHASNFKIG